MTAKRALSRADIMAMEDYAKIRAEQRKAIAGLKKDRRMAVGPFAMFYFESYDTMWLQVHEMLFIECGGEDQIAGELEAYNPLIPKGKDLVATLMFEIDDPVRRDRELRRLGGVEDTVRLEIGDHEVMAMPIQDQVERSTPEGKTSSVQFLRFPLSDAQIAEFRGPSVRLVLGFRHAAYAHMAVMPEATRAALAEDLN
jgi:hypothetical protein